MVWNICTVADGVNYEVRVDWNNNDSFIDPNENIVTDVLDRGLTISRGRDQERQLSPGQVGRAAFSVCNVLRRYSPENPASDLYAYLQPGRRTRMQATYQTATYPMFEGRIDDFDVHPDRSDRSVDFTLLDGMALLQQIKISTALYAGIRTGDMINIILDAAGWTEGRNIDAGASFAYWWWVEGQTASDAINDVVAAEGPPAIAYIGPEGEFIFRDRHHRYIRQVSYQSQGDFSARRVACDTPAITGLSYTAPFEYSAGWRDIINDVSQDVDQRIQEQTAQTVWSSDSGFTILSGQTISIKASASDPFLNAITPTTTGTDPDIVWAGGAASLSVSLSRTSGQSVVISIMAVGGDANVTSVMLRAQPVPVARTIGISERDTGSVSEYGLRTYPQEIPLVTVNDAQAVAQVIVGNYAYRRPIVRLRVASCDPEHFLQQVQRQISDMITIRNDELGLNAPFHIEHIDHTLRRIKVDRPPVHETVWGCEKDLAAACLNPFTFDEVGAGFDQGCFDGTVASDPATIWTWDTQSQFDVNVLGL